MYELTDEAKQYLAQNFQHANDNNYVTTIAVTFGINQYVLTYDFTISNETLSVYRYNYDNSQTPIFVKAYSHAPTVFNMWTDLDVHFVTELFKLLTDNRLNAVLR